MDKALKQRLVGATVLIILTVIILPMLLSGRSDTLKQESSQIEIPKKPEELSISKRRFPVGIPDKPTAAVPETSPENDPALFEDGVLDGESVSDFAPPLDAEPEAVVLEEDATGLTPAATGDETGSTESEADSSEPESGAAIVDSNPVEQAPEVTTVIVPPDPDDVNLDIVEDSDSNSPRYLVQVASFSSEKRANLLADELRGVGLNVEQDIVERTAGRLHRVRVGPYNERSEADAAIGTIKSTNNNLSPRLVDLRPSDSAPVSTPSDPLVRWVVQVGSFSSAESADSQVAELRLAGLAAYAEEVTSSKGSVYKVRVGPEVNRDKATELAKRIKAEQKLDGFVTTQE